jgi:hypothetical protein
MTSLLDIQWLSDRARAEVDPAGRALTILVARGPGTSMA